MASPQKENGFTPIANEILEQLIASNLNGTEIAIVLFIIRKTYGFKKTEDEISLSQFMRAIPVSKPTICKALRTLQLVKIVKLVKKGDSLKCSNKYSLNKDYDLWQLVKKSKLVKKTKRTSKDFDTQLVKKPLHTKDTFTKETIQKKIPKGIQTESVLLNSKDLNNSLEVQKEKEGSYGRPEINQMLETIKEVLQLTDFKEPQKAQRQYGQHLVNLKNKLGRDEFGQRFMTLKNDPFHFKNMGSLKYIYNQIKGFVPNSFDGGNVTVIY